MYAKKYIDGNLFFIKAEPVCSCDSSQNGLNDGEGDRSSPSGQSDQASSGRTIVCQNEHVMPLPLHSRKYVTDKVRQIQYVTQTTSIKYQSLS